MTMDVMTAVEPPLVHAGLPAELPDGRVSPSNTPITPLDLIEGPKVRTKLRLYAILLALYVPDPSPVFSQYHLANGTL